MWSGEVVGAFTPFQSQNFWALTWHPLMFHHDTNHPDFIPPPTYPGRTKANFLNPSIITNKNIYSWHGTHLQNRKILWSRGDNHDLIHHDHQQPETTTSAIPITTNIRSTKVTFIRHRHHPLHPSNISQSPKYWSRVRHPLSDSSRQVDITNTTAPTSLSPPHLPPRPLHKSYHRRQHWHHQRHSHRCDGTDHDMMEQNLAC